MADAQEFTFPSSDHIHAVQARKWTPEGPPRAVLQIVHGISEHMGRYDHTAQFFAQHGFLVCGEDHLGHGKTVDDGRFGYFAPKDGWRLVTEDIHHLRELMGQQYPEIPYFILGHSMGSFLARTYLIRWPGTLSGVILSGTGQEPAPLIGLGKGLSGLLCTVKGPDGFSPLIYALSMGTYNKKFQPARTRSDWLSRDEAMVDAHTADPLCDFYPTVSMFRDMMEGLQFIANRENLSKMDPDTPVYFFSGDRDPVGSEGQGVKKVVGMFRQAGCRDVTLKLYPDGRHEMLNEINRQEVMADLLTWLGAHL